MGNSKVFDWSSFQFAFGECYIILLKNIRFTKKYSMKAKLLFFTLFLTNMLFAQKDEKKVVFFGFDFSNVKCIGSGEFADLEKLRGSYFPGWNKYFDERRDNGECSVKKNFNKETVIYDYAIVTQRNSETDIKNIVIDDVKYAVNDGMIANALKTYDTDLTGLGLVIMVEALNKKKEIVTMHAVFFDIKTKKVVFKKRLIGKTSGFGFNNYWESGLVRGFRSFKY